MILQIKKIYDGEGKLAGMKISEATAESIKAFDRMMFEGGAKPSNYRIIDIDSATGNMLLSIGSMIDNVESVKESFMDKLKDLWIMEG